MLPKLFSICFLSRAFSLCVVSLEHGALRPVAPRSPRVQHYVWLLSLSHLGLFES
jgi:hypothetical protein